MFASLFQQKPEAFMRILSGVQPSGKLHIGNYFGAIRQYVALQSEHDGFYFMANYHALTTVHDGPTLRQQTNEIAADFLALGLDPARATIFRQSDIPEVCELTWVLSCICPMGLLERCHAYKDKVQQGIPAEHGLFAYPVLMAADILIYGSDVVPVGKDQKQHVEVTRDIALRFNNQYGEVFKIPEERIREEVAVVPGLDGQKMSKSYGNTIELFGPEKETRKKFMRIVTDSKGVDDAKDPATCSIFALHKLFATAAQSADLAARYRAGGLAYGFAKQELYELFMEQFAKFRQRREEILADPGHVDAVLRDGAAKARATAEAMMGKVRQAVGLR